MSFPHQTFTIFHVMKMLRDNTCSQESVYIADLKKKKTQLLYATRWRVSVQYDAKESDMLKFTQHKQRMRQRLLTRFTFWRILTASVGRINFCCSSRCIVVRLYWNSPFNALFCFMYSKPTSVTQTYFPTCLFCLRSQSIS